MTQLYTQLVSRWLFPLHEKLKGHDTVSVRKEMERSQWLSPETIAQKQIESMKAFLEHAGSNVPYYRNVFSDYGFDPSTVTSLEDLSRIPFLTKEIIRNNQEFLKSETAKSLARFNTGGSSGEPLIFYIGKKRISHDVAAKWRATRWWNVDIGDREIVLWGSPIELGTQDRVRMIRDKLLRTRLLEAFEMSPEKLGDFIDAICRFRPRMLFGYPSAFAYLARYAMERNIALDKLGIRVAFVTSERLYEYQKSLIEEVFGCPVANGYGGRDAGFIAHQCELGGMHITAEDIVVELIDQEGNTVPKGQPGEVVITHLATGDYPFIRYRTGDIAIIDTKRCDCGRGLPLLKEIQGRATDFVIALDGTAMHGLALIYVVRDIPGVREFKIIQESLDKTRIMIVPGKGFGPDEKAKIIMGIKQRLGKSVDVDVEEVGEIPPEKSGKFRYVISLVDHP